MIEHHHDADTQWSNTYRPFQIFRAEPDKIHKNYSDENEPQLEMEKTDACIICIAGPDAAGYPVSIVERIEQGQSFFCAGIFQEMQYYANDNSGKENFQEMKGVTKGKHHYDS